MHILIKSTTPDATPDDPNPLRSFLVFSLPISDETPVKEEKGHVRGLFVCAEELKEQRNDRGEVEIVWRGVSQSTPGGSIPIKLAESYMCAFYPSWIGWRPDPSSSCGRPSSMAALVPAFFAWMAANQVN